MVFCPKCQRPMVKISSQLFACTSCELAASLNTLEWLRIMLTEIRRDEHHGTLSRIQAAEHI